MESPQHDEKASKTDYAGSEVVATVSSSKSSSGVEVRHQFALAEIDTAALLAMETVPVTPEQDRALLRKIDWHLLPFMLALYALQFLAKTSLGLSVLLDLKTQTGVSTAQYNILSTIFYVSYLVFEYPQSLGLQRYPVGKYLAWNIIAWSVLLCLHAACTNFTGLVIVRFLLGIAEGSITPGFLIITSQYYTASEQSQRVGAWFLMNGTAIILGGLLTYGLLHVGATALAAWRVLFLIVGGVCGVFGVAWWFYFPDSSVTAWFLTPEERVMVVQRIRVNQTGVENKTFKRHQVIEALHDRKIWLFVLFSVLDNIPNSLTNQSSTIYLALKFSKDTSALLNLPTGLIEILTIGSSIWVMSLFPNQRGYIAALYSITQILGSILVLALPESNSIGKLVSIFLTGVGTTGFVIALSWLQVSTAGHTKRTTAQAMNLIGYCVGNIIGPQIWQAKFAPVNVVPWSVVLACYLCLPPILLLIRWDLARENARRDAVLLAEKSDGITKSLADDFVEIEKDGKIQLVKVDKGFLDLTDKENQSFRYPL